MHKLFLLFATTGILFANSLAVTPNSGTITAGQSQPFTLSYTGQIGGVMLALVPSSGTGNSCYVAYVASTNNAFLANDAATTWAYQGVLGSSTVLQNRQCSVDLANSRATGTSSGTTLNLAVTFTDSFIGDRALYLRSWDGAGNATPWLQSGALTISARAVAPPPNPAPANGLDAEESSFLTILNNYRSQNGLGPLQISTTLESSSRWMSNDMAAKNYFSHTDSLGRDPFARMANFGYPVYQTSAGENLGAGNAGAQATFNQWLNACDADASGTCTYGHRMNMLNPNYQKIGIARAFGSTSSYQWYWTTDFGGI